MPKFLEQIVTGELTEAVEKLNLTPYQKK